LFAQVAGAGVPINLELVTVTDTQAVITWFTCDPTSIDEFGRPDPVPTPGRVLIGTTPDVTSWEPVGEHGPTAYHYVELSRLRPGTTYYWRAESNGIPAVPTAFSPQHQRIAAPPVFTTLTPPSGRELMTVAWLNDMHIGEHTSGLAYSDSRFPRGGLPPGFPVDPDDPYWRTMGHAAVREAEERGCRFMLVNGDLSNEAEPAALDEAKRMLDNFGKLGGTKTFTTHSKPAYFVTRGNHDRAHSGPMWGSCSRVADRPELRDCFIDVFGKGFDKGTTKFAVTVGDDGARYRFVGLDSNFADETGVLRPDELDYLEAELERGDATIPLLHHPVADLAQLAGVPPGMIGLDLPDAMRFQELVARHDNVAAVYNGHTHRNYRATATNTGDVPYFEGGAVKEYPGGFTTVRLHEGGFMLNFWKTRDPKARAWSERSRGEYLGLYPYYTLGSFEDRNWVHAFDASAGRSASKSPSRAPDRDAPELSAVAALPATGSSEIVTAAGGAAIATLGALGVAATSRDADRPSAAD
jgi:3',5'-cyclic-AMP phosphodiesterase